MKRTCEEEGNGSRSCCHRQSLAPGPGWRTRSAWLPGAAPAHGTDPGPLGIAGDSLRSRCEDSAAHAGGAGRCMGLQLHRAQGSCGALPTSSSRRMVDASDVMNSLSRWLMTCARLPAILAWARQQQHMWRCSRAVLDGMHIRLLWKYISCLCGQTSRISANEQCRIVAHHLVQACAVQRAFNTWPVLVRQCTVLPLETALERTRYRWPRQRHRFVHNTIQRCE